MRNLGTLEDYNAAKRSVFIIDRNGKVQYKWVSDNPLIEPNYQEVKNSISKIKQTYNEHK
jgi:peroxiredoxin